MINGEKIMDYPVRMGMVGGGRGSFFGYIYRSAALRDKNFELLAGVFHTDHGRCRDFGKNLGIAEERCYADYKAMFLMEAKRADGIEAVTICTPNSTHYEIAKAALNAGLHVICEKPLCFKVEEAEDLAKISAEKDLFFGVTFGYSGYQMVHQARQMILRGDIGKVRIVTMQFAHGAFNVPLENESTMARWRVDPKIAGPSFVIGDIGSHILFIGETMIPDFEIEKVLCYSQHFIKGRELEDNAFVLLQIKGGIAGTLWASAVNAGSVHGQKIRVVGEKASLSWWDEHPNQLAYEIEGEPARLLDRAQPYLYPEALEYDRLAAGHAEGIFESWSNLYRRFALAIDAFKRKDREFLKNFWYPDVKAGVRGVKFVDACLRSAGAGCSWVDY